MKTLFIIFSLSMVFYVSSAARIAGFEGYKKITSPKEIADLDLVIQSGTITALNLAAADNIIENNAARRFQIDDVKYISKLAKPEEDSTSYFVVVKTMDQYYHDVKVAVGFVIDQNNSNKRLSMKAYKIGAGN